MTTNIIHVRLQEQTLLVFLDIGLVIFVPSDQFHRLAQASEAELLDVKIIGGRGLRWEALDEDLSLPRLASAAVDWV